MSYLVLYAHHAASTSGAGVEGCGVLLTNALTGPVKPLTNRTQWGWQDRQTDKQYNGTSVITTVVHRQNWERLQVIYVCLSKNALFCFQLSANRLKCPSQHRHQVQSVHWYITWNQKANPIKNGGYITQNVLNISTKGLFHPPHFTRLQIQCTRQREKDMSRDFIRGTRPTQTLNIANR